MRMIAFQGLVGDAGRLVWDNIISVTGKDAGIIWLDRDVTCDVLMTLIHTDGIISNVNSTM